MNPNIPSKTNSFQRLQNKEVSKLKIRDKMKKKKIEDFGNLTITSYVKFKVKSIRIKQSL